MNWDTEDIKFDWGSWCMAVALMILGLVFLWGILP